MTPVLDVLNSVARPQAIAMISPLVERSPWVAELAIDSRPFDCDNALAQALIEVIYSAGSERRNALFNVHPELAGTEATKGQMTKESTSEQARLGLMSLTAPQARILRDFNVAYRARFGHPFIVALHQVPNLDTLFETFERRLKARTAEEQATTLSEIASVIRARAARAFGPHAHIAALQTFASPHLQGHLL